MLGQIFEQSIQESRPKIRGPKSSCKRLGQKAKPGPSTNRFKWQNNNPKTGRRAKVRRPAFGLLFSNLNRFLEGPGLAFWPSLFQLEFGPLIFGLDSWIDSSKIFPSIFQTFQRNDFPKNILSKTASWRRHHPKSIFQRRFFQNCFSPKIDFFSEAIFQNRCFFQNRFFKTDFFQNRFFQNRFFHVFGRVLYSKLKIGLGKIGKCFQGSVNHYP